MNYLPPLRALLALNHGEPSKAIELLRIAMPYENGTPFCSNIGFFGIFYPVYVRGQTYRPHAKAPKRPRNSKEFWITAVLSLAIR